MYWSFLGWQKTKFSIVGFCSHSRTSTLAVAHSWTWLRISAKEKPALAMGSSDGFPTHFLKPGSNGLFNYGSCNYFILNSAFNWRKLWRKPSWVYQSKNKLTKQWFNHSPLIFPAPRVSKMWIVKSHRLCSSWGLRNLYLILSHWIQ